MAHQNALSETNARAEHLETGVVDIEQRQAKLLLLMEDIVRAIKSKKTEIEKEVTNKEIQELTQKVVDLKIEMDVKQKELETKYETVVQEKEKLVVLLEGRVKALEKRR